MTTCLNSSRLNGSSSIKVPGNNPYRCCWLCTEQMALLGSSRLCSTPWLVWWLLQPSPRYQCWKNGALRPAFVYILHHSRCQTSLPALPSTPGPQQPPSRVLPNSRFLTSFLIHNPLQVHPTLQMRSLWRSFGKKLAHRHISGKWLSLDLKPRLSDFKAWAFPTMPSCCSPWRVVPAPPGPFS